MDEPNFSVDFKSGLITEMRHLKSGSVVLTDAPVDNNGKGSTFSPTDFIATSLASCMLTVLAIHFEKKNEILNPVSAQVKKVMKSNPRRIGQIIIEFDFKNNKWSKKEWKVVERVINTCPVANSLSQEIEIITNLKALQDALA